MERMKKYQHKEASRRSGTAVTYTLHKEEFPGEKCVDQHRCPRLSERRDIHGALPTREKTASLFVNVLS